MTKKSFEQYMRLLLISEIISLPFDEGLKNILYNLIKNFSDNENIHILTKKGNNTDGLKVDEVFLDKLFLSRELRTSLKKIEPDIILYIPEASHTFNSFIRARVLKLCYRRAKIVLFGVQHRKLSFFKKYILCFTKPDLLLLLNKMDQSYFKKNSINVKTMPPAVDCGKFCMVSNKTKELLREKYNIPLNKTVILHVGHIKTSRNLECFIDIQKNDNVQVVIVGSTSTQMEEKLKKTLEGCGIITFTKYLHDIQEIYQLSDIYVFPVFREDAAIDMPLSVLEALSCNLPVITTRFGALSEHFEEDTSFKYFNSNEELVELVKQWKLSEIQNSKKVEQFSWNRFADEILHTCNELI